jgi:predicted RNase H-like HicB family nuclease
MNETGRVGMKQRFLVVYEHGKRNYCGFSPDIPGCISTGKTLKKMREMMREAIEFHLEGIAEDGDEMPTPVTANVDFKDLDDLEEGGVDHYVVEWLEIVVPISKPRIDALMA